MDSKKRQELVDNYISSTKLRKHAIRATPGLVHTTGSFVERDKVESANFKTTCGLYFFRVRTVRSLTSQSPVRINPITGLTEWAWQSISSLVDLNDPFRSFVLQVDAPYNNTQNLYTQSSEELHASGYYLMSGYLNVVPDIGDWLKEYRVCTSCQMINTLEGASLGVGLWTGMLARLKD